MGSILEANISDIDIQIDDRFKSPVEAEPEGEENVRETVLVKRDSEEWVGKVVEANFVEGGVMLPEVPFVHWSIYK